MTTAGVESPRRSRHARGRRWFPALVMLGPLLVFMLVFYALPFGNLIHESFEHWEGDEVEISGYTTLQYEKTVTRSRTAKSLTRTFRISFIATVITLVISFPVAMLLLRAGRRLRSAILLITFVSLASSLIVRNYGWLVVLADSGPVNNLLIGLGIIDYSLRMAYSEGATIVALVHYCMPFMILPIYGALLRIPASLTEASTSLAATSWKTLRRIVLPLSVPGVFGGTMLSFAICMSAYVTPLMLGSPSTAMISQVAAEQLEVQLNFPWGSAIIATLTAATFLVVFVYAALVQRVMRTDV